MFYHLNFEHISDMATDLVFPLKFLPPANEVAAR